MSGYWIMAGDLEFTDEQLDPFVSLGNIMAFSSRDWGAHREEAWLYGIVMGWGLEALADLAPRFNWTPPMVKRLRLLHLNFRRAEVHGTASIHKQQPEEA